ncbi:sensor histidine kinase [Undibacterium sp. MH2W]|uniref:sensor histidine kinase n=1 Tax=Undibacterium sp. MH2W TaxID=3413044 RepID=UPI003BF06EFF
MSMIAIASLTIHDVKNKLASIAGVAEMHGDEDTVRAMLHASELLTQLLVFFRAEHHDLALNIAPHTPEDLIAEIAINQYTKRQIVVCTDTSNAPAIWMYDEALIRMILMNALQNALRYAHRGVAISAKQTGDFLEICVKDDGPGFPSELIANEAFSAPVSAHGTGLGLMLAKRVAALHQQGERQGHIHLFNENGAVFMLRLPA